jgi:phage pi2 protein 07
LKANKTLNIEWLSKYFKIEPKDELVLSQSSGRNIDKGGMIFYAKYNEVSCRYSFFAKMNEFLNEQNGSYLMYKA